MNPLSLAALRPLYLIFALAFVQTGIGQTNDFSYQGSLNISGQPATGSYDMEFALFDSLSGGLQTGSTLTRTNVVVSNGVFTVTLNFGSVFTGAARFLEIRVRPAGGGAYTLLTPRQAVSSSPYAVRSASSANADVAATATNLNNQPASFYTNAGNLSSGTLPSARLAGTYSQALNLSNASNVFAGSGSALTSLDAGNISTGTLADGRLSGNVPLENGINNFTNTNSFNFGTKSLQVRNDSGLVPGLNVTGTGGNLGILRLRNAIEIWPSDDASRAGNLDVRNPAGNATITLNGASGNITATGNINGANTPAIKVAQTFRDARTLGPNRIFVQDSFQNLETLTVNVPAEGYLLLTATANIASVWVSSSGGLQVIKGHLKIEETTSGSPVQLVEHSSYLIPITTNSANQAADVAVVSWVVPVASAGQRTFRSAITVEGGLYVYTTSLSAQYFPNSL
ncbi:MAG: hypothetical protein QUS14_00570 [Pyrinomonadaceae bacterium]|nr:hypothetical protein [Pyrinomonadaceae bacterium]